jgi:peptidoglycan/xylan/chitin deacetylase (PgdA/CDA1 family)
MPPVRMAPFEDRDWSYPRHRRHSLWAAMRGTGSLPGGKFLCVVIRLTLLPWVLREVFHRKKVTILLYHDPSPRTFASHLATLEKTYNIVSLRRFVEAHLAGTLAGLPPKSLVLTFDDGHRGNYALKSLLQDLPAPPTIFVCSGVIGTSNRFWFQLSSDCEPLKRIPDDERLAELAAHEEEHRSSEVEPEALSREQIAELKPFVDFESHTISHPILPYCNEAKAWTEISDSKRLLESSYGLSVFALSYPNGDYSAREVMFARKAGYTCGLSVDFGFNSAGTDLYRVRRIAIDDEDDSNKLVLKACGLWGFVKRLVVTPTYGYTETPAVDS